MTKRSTLLIYGNCQSGALAKIFRAHPDIAEIFDVRYFPSFDDHVAGSREIGPDTLAATSLYFEQIDRNTFEHRERLDPHCEIVTFPALDLNLLWPRQCRNVFSVPEPGYPWGVFPYSDRRIVDCVQRGLCAEETLALYHKSSGLDLPDLARLSAVEHARLRARETTLSVTMSDYVLERFAQTNLFWTMQHPTLDPLFELAQRLLRTAAENCAVVRNLSLAAASENLRPDGPIGFFGVPIHPAIVDHFDLEWYRRADERNFGLRYVSPLDYDGYFRELTAYSTAVRDGRHYRRETVYASLIPSAVNSRRGCW